VDKVVQELGVVVAVAAVGVQLLEVDMVHHRLLLHMEHTESRMLLHMALVVAAVAEEVVEGVVEEEEGVVEEEEVEEVEEQPYHLHS